MESSHFQILSRVVEQYWKDHVWQSEKLLNASDDTGPVKKIQNIKIVFTNQVGSKEVPELFFWMEAQLGISMGNIQR